ncbi:MAG: tetraacyldisaccharide 4'-kinase [Prevotella sp.]|nr:tetraacyldisaccharide 4'-kinase [Prevotella sp.]
MQGDFIKINMWLKPLSWIYGLVVDIRNQMFDWGILKSRSFDTPVISVGNITVGGSGKTPHVEYLIRLLNQHIKVAVLSRGYKRKSKGFVLADNDTPMSQIGDEPYQMKQKFPDIYVAVDKDRCHGIDTLLNNEATKDTGVILLDDAFQHRYVTPGINILLVDYHRLITHDALLPAGRLREPVSGKDRADIVIVTKCPKDLKAIDYRVLTKTMSLYPYQNLYFTYIDYCNLHKVWGEDELRLDDLSETNVLLLTGIASPQQLLVDLKEKCQTLTPLSFPDHHQFTEQDILKINDVYSNLSEPKIIITTEKDTTRMKTVTNLDDNAKDNTYVLPIKVAFLQKQEPMFNNKILSYVQKNSRNSILVKRKDADKPKDSDNTGNRPRTISFRNI